MSSNDIIGQPYALTILNNSLSKNRMPSAYLFYGQTGVGKNRTAKLLAKSICCLNKQEIHTNIYSLTPCNQCPSCAKIEQNIHPDITEIVPEGDFLKIEQIRNLQKKLCFRPSEANKKIFLLDQIEKMNQESANCFLKSLEEPPPYVIFILITNSIASLLPTIISRCQPVRFTLLSDKLVFEIIKQWDIEIEKAKRLAFWAEGSPGKAKEYLDAKIFEHQEKFLKHIDKLKDNLRYAFKIAEETKESPDLFLDILSFWIRERLWEVIAHSLSEKGIKTPEHQNNNRDVLQHTITSPFSQFHPNKLLILMELIGQTRNQINRRANVLLALEVLFIKLKSLL